MRPLDDVKWENMGSEEEFQTKKNHYDSDFAQDEDLSENERYFGGGLIENHFNMIFLSKSAKGERIELNRLSL